MAICLEVIYWRIVSTLTKAPSLFSLVCDSISYGKCDTTTSRSASKATGIRIDCTIVFVVAPLGRPEETRQKLDRDSADSMINTGRPPGRTIDSSDNVILYQSWKTLNTFANYNTFESHLKKFNVVAVVRIIKSLLTCFLK